MIQEGISKKNKTHIELNRSLAIKKAIDELKDDEILLIAGKGHENSQIVGNRIIEYSDYEEIKKCIV
jgi:UDP-N-acetylmuramoyl-L-alanyl-D-glutamate--2,6-diaminopimelate ligase